MVIALMFALAAYVVWTAPDPRPHQRVVAVTMHAASRHDPAIRTGGAIKGRRHFGSLGWNRVASSLALGAGVFVVVGGVLGGIAAAAILTLGPVLLSKLEPTRVRQEREAATAQLPEVAMLLGSCLAAGATLRDASAAVRDAIDEPLKTTLSTVVARMDLGADPAACWSVDSTAGRKLIPLAAAFERTARTGAPVQETLARLAEDLDSERGRALESAAKAIGIKAVAPLGFCFLPAFLLIGVVPVVAGFVRTLWIV